MSNSQIMSTQAMTQQIAEYFKTQPILKAWLYGSYSRGEQRADSDVDILILPDKSQHFSLFTLSEIYEDLKEMLFWGFAIKKRGCAYFDTPS